MHIFFPNKGFFSYQFNLSEKLTTSPTTIITGDSSLASFTFSTIFSKLPITFFALR